MKSLPAGLIKLNQLEKLYIRSSQINTYPEEISSLPNLKILDLACNESLKIIPESITKLTKLEELTFGGGACGGSPIEKLPENISDLKNLKALDLGHTHFKTLPASFCQLKNLNSVSLGNSSIMYLPDCIGDLSNLRQVGIYGGNLLKVPDSFFNLKLDRLYVDIYSTKPSILLQEKQLIEFCKTIRKCNFAIEGVVSDRANDPEIYIAPDHIIAENSPYVGTWQFVEDENHRHATLHNFENDTLMSPFNCTVIKISPGSENSMLAHYYYEDGKKVIISPTSFKAKEYESFSSSKSKMSCILDDDVYAEILGSDYTFEFYFSYSRIKDMITISFMDGTEYDFIRFKK